MVVLNSAAAAVNRAVDVVEGGGIWRGVMNSVDLELQGFSMRFFFHCNFFF